MTLQISRIDVNLYTPEGTPHQVVFTQDAYKGTPDDQFIKFLITRCGYSAVKIEKNFTEANLVIERMDNHG